MHAIRTSNEFIFVQDTNGNRVGTYSTRSKLHMDTLLEVVGKNVMDLLEFNVDSMINIKTLEVIELSR